MRIRFNGSVSDSAEIKAGFIGCGPHSFRNIYPALHFVPESLMTLGDFYRRKAVAFTDTPEKSYFILNTATKDSCTHENY